MELICIDNKGQSSCFTVGKCYQAFPCFITDYLSVLDDNNKQGFYKRSRFITKKEIAKNRLKDL